MTKPVRYDTDMTNTATTETPITQGEITNTCTCTVIDPETFEEVLDEHGETIPTTECYGDCWDYALEMFGMDTEELRKANPEGWWAIDNVRLWNGDFSGYQKATTVADLIRAMTVRSEWIMRYSVFPDRVEYSLSHHDAPMGSASVLRPMSPDEPF